MQLTLSIFHNAHNVLYTKDIINNNI